MWVATFKSPGFDETWNNASGSGALGVADGSQNGFTASANGTAALSVFMPAGTLSEFGSVGNCLPSEKDEVHLFGAYHLDHQTHGASPGGPGTWVVQFDFPI